jgi:hypothetical protein
VEAPNEGCQTAPRDTIGTSPDVMLWMIAEHFGHNIYYK